MKISVSASEPTIRRILGAIGYKGRTVQLAVTDEPLDLRSYWDGGSRDYWHLVDLTRMRTIGIPQQGTFDARIPGLEAFRLRPNIAAVRHTIFQGHDLGVMIYIHPVNGTPYLPKPVELTPDEWKVLEVADAYVASIRRQEAGLPAERYDAAKSSLIARGLLNRAGAITAAGRNALEAHREEQR